MIIGKFKDVTKDATAAVKHSWLAYFSKLIYRTIGIGLLSYLLSYLYSHSEFRDISVPPTMHSLIGIVIGLLLVFRTNTSYERWWEGRKSIQAVSDLSSVITVKLETCMPPDLSSVIKDNLKKFVNNFRKYLKANTEAKTDEFHKKQLDEIYRMMRRLKEAELAGIITSRDAGTIEGYMADLIRAAGTCDRIKKTPIPASYAIHIKICLFVYLLSLPFGMFRDLGVGSTLMVMLIFYIAAGIEIISNEIENPFAGDPNDLPVDDLTNDIIKNID